MFSAVWERTRIGIQSDNQPIVIQSVFVYPLYIYISTTQQKYTNNSRSIQHATQQSLNGCVFVRLRHSHHLFLPIYLNIWIVFRGVVVLLPQNITKIVIICCFGFALHRPHGHKQSTAFCIQTKPNKQSERYTFWDSTTTKFCLTNSGCYESASIPFRQIVWWEIKKTNKRVCFLNNLTTLRSVYLCWCCSTSLVLLSVTQTDHCSSILYSSAIGSITTHTLSLSETTTTTKNTAIESWTVNPPMSGVEWTTGTRMLFTYSQHTHLYRYIRAYTRAHSGHPTVRHPIILCNFYCCCRHVSNCTRSN